MFLFSWNAVSGADNYHYQISSTPDFSSDVGEGLISETTLVAEALPANATGYWRVRARERQ